MITMIRFLIILLLGFIFLHACVRILTGCQPIPAGDVYDKQAKLVGFVQHKGSTQVYFVLRSNCWCDTVIINYQWEKVSVDQTRYIQNEKYTIHYKDGKAASFSKNL
jgi:hypothetical protein